MATSKKPVSVTVQKGIPMPVRGPSVYPWSTIQVGESFEVIGKHAHMMAACQTKTHKGKTVIEFKARLMEKRRDGKGKEVHVYRIWRTI